MKNKKIQIPHLGYTVEVVNKNKAKGKVKEFLLKFNVCTEDIDEHTSRIYLDFPIKQSHHATIAHEIIHVLGHICSKYGIHFENEGEHMAYITQYLFNKITGYEYVK